MSRDSYDFNIPNRLNIFTTNGILLNKALFLMSPQISYRGNKNPIKKKLSFFEGGHQLEKLEFALAVAQTKGDREKSLILRKKIVELGGNVEEPGT
tara:strand:- start:1116 stop:1403 length:288 start_codon:yes stop_codon:yes gene_type:complete